MQEELSAAFSRMTVNQMMTLIDLHELRYAHEVAKYQKRDLSSVLKQLNTLNNTFMLLCGEQLVDTNTGRGKAVEFSETGEAVVGLVCRFLEESRSTIDMRRREVGKKLTAASTTGMLSAIARIWPKWQEEARGAFDLSLVQIRTYEVQNYLREGRVDLVFAGQIEQKQMEHDSQAFEFLRWSPGSQVVLMSNHTKLPSDPVSLSDIIDGRIAIIMPNHGIIRDFIDLVGGNLERANIVARIDDFPFGCGLLANSLYQASMFVIESLADKTIGEQAQSSGIRFHKYHIKGLESVLISSGAFRRHGAEKYASNHPINVCWKILKEESERHLAGQGDDR